MNDLRWIESDHLRGLTFAFVMVTADDEASLAPDALE